MKGRSKVCKKKDQPYKEEVNRESCVFEGDTNQQIRVMCKHTYKNKYGHSTRVIQHLHSHEIVNTSTQVNTSTLTCVLIFTIPCV